MPALLTVIHDGKVEHCDERCYNAKHEKCTCICGGKNHGVGFRKALENVMKMAKSEQKAGEIFISQLGFLGVVEK